MWFQGSDMHVAATLHSSECKRTIKASFFFDPEYVPKPCLVGEQIRLIGARLQLWKGCLQLTGKNIRFGQPLVSMTLSNAIAAWKYVTGVQPLLFLRKNTTRAQRCFPKLTMIVNVKMWDNAKTTIGAQMFIITFAYDIIHTCCQVVMCTFQLRFHAHPMRIAQSEDLSSLSRNFDPKHSLSEIAFSSLVLRCKNGMVQRNCREEMFRLMKY